MWACSSFWSQENEPLADVGACQHRGSPKRPDVMSRPRVPCPCPPVPSGACKELPSPLSFPAQKRRVTLNTAEIRFGASGEKGRHSIVEHAARSPPGAPGRHHRDGAAPAGRHSRGGGGVRRHSHVRVRRRRLRLRPLYARAKTLAHIQTKHLQDSHARSACIRCCSELRCLKIFSFV